jgi:hypothetical protein
MNGNHISSPTLLFSGISFKASPTPPNKIFDPFLTRPQSIVYEDELRLDFSLLANSPNVILKNGLNPKLRQALRRCCQIKRLNPSCKTARRESFLLMYLQEIRGRFHEAL